MKLDIQRAVVALHRELGLEWLPLKVIYQKVEEIRGKSNVNGGASIRASLETHCSTSLAFSGENLYVLKEKGSGLYQSVYYDQIVKIKQLERGDIFTREELMNLFKISGQSGMMKTNALDAMVLVTSSANGTYEDSAVVNGRIIYTGEGLVGDQFLTKNNKTLYNSLKDHLYIFLFTKNEERQYIYEGRVFLYQDPYQIEEEDSLGNMRKVWKFPLQIVDFFDDELVIDSQYVELVKELEHLDDKIEVSVDDQELIFVDGPLNLQKYNKTDGKASSRRTTKPDYIANAIMKGKQGDLNEERVYQYELEKLKKQGAIEQVKRMEEFFANRKDDEGFDILSFSKDQNGQYVEKYIEVKSTKGGESTPIDITLSEIKFANDHKDQYYLYRVISCNSKNRYVKVVTGRELFFHFDFEPMTFKIYSK